MNILEGKHVLLVDDSRENIIVAKEIIGDMVQLSTAKSGKEAIIFLKDNKVDLVLLDIMMPDIDGVETAKIIKANPETADIPLIFLTADNSAERETECIELGAVDFIEKPYKAPIVKMRIKRALEYAEAKELLEFAVEVKNTRILQMQQKIIVGFAELVESRDDFTGRHIKRTSAYVEAICKEILKRNLYGNKYGREYFNNVILSAPMHDIGKIAIPDAILCKPAKLDDDEFEIMKTHATAGYKILRNILPNLEKTDYIDVALDVALHHHEKWDGNGYPSKLNGEAIPLSARIMALADVFDALISKRCYKAPMPMDKAFAIIEESSGTHFDPKLAKLFIEIRPEIERISKLDQTDM